MQLLVLALLLLASGNNGNMRQMQPIFQSLGGEAAEAFEKAEELTQMISAVQSLTGGLNVNAQGGGDCPDLSPIKNCEGYPLQPISAIADERITYCMTKYLSQTAV